MCWWLWFTFRMFICFLNMSENCFFLFVPSSSPLSPPSSSYLQVMPALISGFTTASRCKSKSKWDKSNISNSKVLLPFKAVALLSSFIKVRQETERSCGLFALSFGLGAEGSRPLQLGSHNFGVATVVAGTCTVWRLVSKELGDGGMATTGGKIRDTSH